MSNTSPADTRPAGWRVIVIEDEMMIAMLLKDMLADLGHSVIAVAGQLDSALRLARDTDADLAILDVNLGGEESFPVAQVLTERGLPFLFATGYGSPDLAEPFQNAITLNKPFEMNDLSQALHRLCA